MYKTDKDLIDYEERGSVFNYTAELLTLIFIGVIILIGMGIL